MKTKLKTIKFAFFTISYAHYIHTHIESVYGSNNLPPEKNSHLPGSKEVRPQEEAHHFSLHTAVLLPYIFPAIPKSKKSSAQLPSPIKSGPAKKSLQPEKKSSRNPRPEEATSLDISHGPPIGNTCFFYCGKSAAVAECVCVCMCVYTA